MRPLADLLPHDEALRRILDACAPGNEMEEVNLDQAPGRVLARDLRAAADVPGFDRAAMDGYALRAADAKASPATLRLGGAGHAGAPLERVIGPGECVQIATGAPLPPGADAVVMVERTRREADQIVVERPLRAFENVSRRGSDFAAGAVVLRSGAEVTPARLAVAAAAGAPRLAVWCRPKVAVYSTGAELRPPEATLGAGEIHDSNGPALAALLREHGADLVEVARVPDDVGALRDVLEGSRADLMLFSGGSSAGERDVLRDAVAAQGSILFHGVRVKPGKPLLLGRVRGRVVVGLPGYPTSCLSDAYLFVVPALRRLAHKPPAPVRRLRARMAARVVSVPDRLWFLPVRVENGLAVPTYKESGATMSMADATGYVTLAPETGSLEEGDEVDVVLF